MCKAVPASVRLFVHVFICTFVWKSLKQDWAYSKTFPFWTVIKERINHSVSQHWQNFQLSDTDCQSFISCLSHCLLMYSQYFALQNPDDPVSSLRVSRELTSLFFHWYPSCAPAVATFTFQLLSHPETQYSNYTLNSLAFQGRFDQGSPAYCCNVARIAAQIHSQLTHLSICLDSNSAKWTVHLSALFWKHNVLTSSKSRSQICHQRLPQRNKRDDLSQTLSLVDLRKKKSAAPLVLLSFFSAFPFFLPAHQCILSELRMGCDRKCAIYWDAARKNSPYEFSNTKHAAHPHERNALR